MSRASVFWRPNHEGAGTVGRSVLGATPFVLIVGIALAPLFLAWLSDPSSPALLGLMIALLAVGLAAAAVGTIGVISCTPRAIGIESDGVLARWGTGRPTTQFVPFERITSITPAGWQWYVGGRVVFARFTPGIVHFAIFGSDRPPGPGNAPVSDGVLYVTRENGDALKAALSGWRDEVSGRTNARLGPQILDEKTARELGEV